MVLGFHRQTDGDTNQAVIDKKCNVIRKEITGGGISMLKNSRI